METSQPSINSRARTKPFSHTARYLAGGIVCALINNIVLIAGDALGVSLTISVLATWMFGGTAGYLWHARVTFAAGYSLRACARFLAGVAVAIPLTWFVLVVLRQWLGWPMEVAAPAATVILFAYNYLNARLAIVQRLFAWKN
jgi:putative flippase GtrA